MQYVSRAFHLLYRAPHLLEPLTHALVASTDNAVQGKFLQLVSTLTFCLKLEQAEKFCFPDAVMPQKKASAYTK